MVVIILKCNDLIPRLDRHLLSTLNCGLSDRCFVSISATSSEAKNFLCVLSVVPVQLSTNGCLIGYANDMLWHGVVILLITDSGE